MAADGDADADSPALTRLDVVAKLNELPVFCLVDAQKQFVAVHVASGTGVNADGTRATTVAATEEAVIFWTEPLEAKSAALQARRQRPEEVISLGTMPLGRAYALVEGWAEAESGGRPFLLRAHSAAVSQLRELLFRQLEHQGLPTTQLFPLFLCEQLSTDALMPAFLSRSDLVSTWESACAEAGRQGEPPPSTVTVMDLRVLVAAMLAGETGLAAVRFVGTQRAYVLASQGARGDTGGEGGAAPVTCIADPDDEPPPLLPHVPAAAGGGGGPVRADRGSKKKTPPNDPCPCGSGTKYKRCCGK
eukprot:scaffold7284_cov115-Isochrysis_galbana.AAC.4